MKQRAQEEIRLQSMDSDPNTVINDLIFGYLFPFVEKEANSEQGSLFCSSDSKFVKLFWMEASIQRQQKMCWTL